MTLEPLLSAALAIQIHVATVIPAAVIGPILFLMRKGTPRHRLLGMVWMTLMFASALSSLFIHEIRLIGGFSPIHLLSLYVMFGTVQAVRAARSGNIAAHRKQVIGLYLGGIVGAGLFTLLPGRIMNALVFSTSALPFDADAFLNLAAMTAAILAGVTVLSMLALRARRPVPQR